MTTLKLGLTPSATKYSAFLPPAIGSDHSISAVARALSVPFVLDPGITGSPAETAHAALSKAHRATGGHAILLGISKRSDRYLRTLLIHGARSAMHTIERRRAARSIWAGGLKLGRGSNVAAVALANKNSSHVGPVASRRELPRRATSCAE